MRRSALAAVLLVGADEQTTADVVPVWTAPTPHVIRPSAVSARSNSSAAEASHGHAAWLAAVGQGGCKLLDASR